jgi:hypothetical protein
MGISYPLELSIIITNFKTTKLLLQLLKSIYSKDSGYYQINGAEVIVLDNSPDEPCKSEVLAAYPKVKFIANPENNGFSAGNNQMISYSLGKYLLLLNSDILVKPHALQNFLQTVHKYGDRAIYGSRLYFPDGQIQDSCYRLPTAWRAFEEYFLGRKGSYFMSAPKGKEVIQVEGVVMASILIPRSVIDEIGSLQEATFYYFEDIEYCRRAKKHGIPIYYVPDAEFIHFHGQAAKKAGVSLSQQRLVTAAKWYHGWLNYALVTAVLWSGQKFGRVFTPKSRWMDEKN